jgi:hypothetical protein
MELVCDVCVCIWDWDYWVYNNRDRASEVHMRSTEVRPGKGKIGERQKSNCGGRDGRGDDYFFVT